MPEDCYIVLGMAPDADPGQIRRAYRRLVRLCHPDAGHPDQDPDAVADSVVVIAPISS